MSKFLTESQLNYNSYYKLKIRCYCRNIILPVNLNWKSENNLIIYLHAHTHSGAPSGEIHHLLFTRPSSLPPRSSGQPSMVTRNQIKCFLTMSWLETGQNNCMVFGMWLIMEETCVNMGRTWKLHMERHGRTHPELQRCTPRVPRHSHVTVQMAAYKSGSQQPWRQGGHLCPFSSSFRPVAEAVKVVNHWRSQRKWPSQCSQLHPGKRRLFAAGIWQRHLHQCRLGRWNARGPWRCWPGAWGGREQVFQLSS